MFKILGYYLVDQWVSIKIVSLNKKGCLQWTNQEAQWQTVYGNGCQLSALSLLSTT